MVQSTANLVPDPLQLWRCHLANLSLY